MVVSLVVMGWFLSINATLFLRGQEERTRSPSPDQPGTEVWKPLGGLVSHHRPQVRQVAVVCVRSIPLRSVRRTVCPLRRHHHGPIMELDHPLT